ncbi:GntR family transcriptional regulator [Microbacterium sp. 22303]|uniref:GntR family transcriptional regulator n=1 Tax=Microbacterium sp. 22303 TaxID=3453905 RepID=UPI003F83B9D1
MTHRPGAEQHPRPAPWKDTAHAPARTCSSPRPALDRLRENIIAGRYRAGDRLIEKNLESEYGVSRTVIREALRQLESEKLVEIVPNVGPRARGLSYGDVVNLYQERPALESAASRLAAQRASISQLKALRTGFDHPTQRATEVDVADLISEENAFYDAPIESSGNPIICEMRASAQARIAQLLFTTLAAPDRVPHMLAELRRVVGAIEAADPTAADGASLSHVDSAVQLALRLIAHLRSTEGNLT